MFAIAVAIGAIGVVPNDTRSDSYQARSVRTVVRVHHLYHRMGKRIEKKGYDHRFDRYGPRDRSYFNPDYGGHTPPGRW